LRSENLVVELCLVGVRKKSGNRECQGEKGRGVLSSEFVYVSGLGPRLSLLGIAYEPFGILSELSACGTFETVDTSCDLWVNHILTTTETNSKRRIQKVNSVNSNQHTISSSKSPSCCSKSKESIISRFKKKNKELGILRQRKIERHKHGLRVFGRWP